MATYTKSDVHIDVALSNVSIRFQNDRYAAEAMMPRVMVGKESDKYYIYGKDNFRNEQALRADGSLATQVGQSLSSDSYSIEEYAYRELVTQRMINNADSALDPMTDATMHLTDKLLLDYEIRVAALLNSGATLTENTTLAGVDQWSAAATSDPIGDILTGINNIKSKAASMPNKILIPHSVWQKLQVHPDVLARIQGSQLGIVSPALFGQIVGLEVVLADAVKNTAVEGQTDVLADVWGKHVVIANVSNSPGLRSQSMGYTFSTQQREVRRYTDEPRRGEWVEASDFYDPKIVSVSDAYLIIDAVA